MNRIYTIKQLGATRFPAISISTTICEVIFSSPLQFGHALEQVRLQFSAWFACRPFRLSAVCFCSYSRTLKEQLEVNPLELAPIMESQATALADTLIKYIDTANVEEGSVQDSKAATAILATAVNGSGGVEVTATICKLEFLLSLSIFFPVGFFFPQD